MNHGGRMSQGVAWIETVAGKRCGVKGPRAAEILAASGIAAPARANTWASLGGGNVAGVIARLGNTEFFIESLGDDSRLAALDRLLARGEPGAHPVLREDFGVLIGGAGAPDALAQVCNIDFAALDLAAQPIVMTSMIGVGVLVLPQPADGEVIYRIWCDPSFGSYLGAALGEVVGESKRKTG